jgi:hypothetical protein
MENNNLYVNNIKLVRHSERGDDGNKNKESYFSMYCIQICQCLGNSCLLLSL